MLYSFEGSNSDLSQRVGIRIQLNDSTIIAEGSHSPDESGAGFHLLNQTSDGSMQIDMDIKAVSSGTARVRRRKIILIRIDDWGE